jgi:hypothetical protein
MMYPHYDTTILLIRLILLTRLIFLASLTPGNECSNPVYTALSV